MTTDNKTSQWDNPFHAKHDWVQSGWHHYVTFNGDSCFSHDSHRVVEDIAGLMNMAYNLGKKQNLDGAKASPDL